MALQESNGCATRKFSRLCVWASGVHVSKGATCAGDVDNKEDGPPGWQQVAGPPGTLVTLQLPTMHALDALGSPVRREILKGLRARPATVGEIAARFPVSRPAISRHLSVLRKAGLISSRNDGPHRVYAVRLQGLAPVRAYLDGFWDTALQRLEELAQESKETADD